MMMMMMMAVGLADRGPRSAGVDRLRAHCRRQPDRHPVVHRRTQHPPADQLLHRFARRQRPADRRHLDAVLHGLPPHGPVLAARSDALRPLAVARLHRLSVFHLHSLLYHHRPVLLRQDPGQVPQLAHRTTGKSITVVTSVFP